MPIKSSKYKAGLWTLKYMPVLMALIMYLHVILMRIGIHTQIAMTIAGSAIIPSILIFTMSSMLKFCYIHKTLTVYSLVVDLFVNFNHYFDLGLYSLEILNFLILLGTGILFLLVCKIQVYQKKCCTLRVGLLKALKRWQKRNTGEVILSIETNI